MLDGYICGYTFDTVRYLFDTVRYKLWGKSTPLNGENGPSSAGVHRGTLGNLAHSTQLESTFVVAAISATGICAVVKVDLHVEEVELRAGEVIGDERQEAARARREDIASFLASSDFSSCARPAGSLSVAQSACCSATRAGHSCSLALPFCNALHRSVGRAGESGFVLHHGCGLARAASTRGMSRPPVVLELLAAAVPLE